LFLREQDSIGFTSEAFYLRQRLSPQFRNLAAFLDSAECRKKWQLTISVPQIFWSMWW